MLELLTARFGINMEIYQFGCVGQKRYIKLARNEENRNSTLFLNQWNSRELKNIFNILPLN